MYSPDNLFHVQLLPLRHFHFGSRTKLANDCIYRRWIWRLSSVSFV